MANCNTYSSTRVSNIFYGFDKLAIDGSHIRKAHILTARSLIHCHVVSVVIDKILKLRLRSQLRRPETMEKRNELILLGEFK